MSKDIMSFYVRLVLPDNKIIVFQMSDLNKSLGEYFKLVLDELKNEEDTDIAILLEEAFKSDNFTCWKKSCNLETEFINLMSKVEKIDGMESDVFEIRL